MTGKLSGQPEVTPKESVNAVAVRARQPAQKPHLLQDASTRWKTVTARNTEAEDGVLEEAEESNTIATQEDPVEPPRTSRDCHDTTILPFLERRRKPVADEQFDKFSEVTKKFYGNIPLLYTMQVPMYAKYLKDILGNKRVLPTTEVVQLTDECRTVYSILSWRRRRNQDAPTSHVPSELNNLSTLFAICEQASASCQT